MDEFLWLYAMEGVHTPGTLEGPAHGVGCLVDGLGLTAMQDVVQRPALSILHHQADWGGG